MSCIRRRLAADAPTPHVSFEVFVSSMGETPNMISPRHCRLTANNMTVPVENVFVFYLVRFPSSVLFLMKSCMYNDPENPGLVIG